MRSDVTLPRREPEASDALFRDYRIIVTPDFGSKSISWLEEKNLALFRMSHLRLQ